MKKTGLVILFLFTIHAFGAFPKNPVLSGVHTSLPVYAVKPAPADTSEIPDHRLSRREQMLLDRKFVLDQMRQRRQKLHSALDKKHWVASVGGFLMGFTGIGFLISRFTHNETLRKGASAGFKVLLIVIGAYIILVLFLVLLFLSLGLIR